MKVILPAAPQSVAPGSGWRFCDFRPQEVRQETSVKQTSCRRCWPIIRKTTMRYVPLHNNQALLFVFEASKSLKTRQKHVYEVDFPLC